MNLIKMLSFDGFFVVNRNLVKKIGLINANVFSFLCTTYTRLEINNKLENDWFYCPIPTIVEELNISDYLVSNSIKELKEKNLIDFIKKGLPAKNYYKINIKTLDDLLSKEHGTSNLNFKALDTENLGDINNNTNNKNNIYISENSKTPVEYTNYNNEPIIKEPKKKQTITPLDQVKEFYTNEIEKNINESLISNYKIFVNFLFETNGSGEPMFGILSIKKQLTFKQFVKIFNEKKDISIMETLSKIEADPKYYKTKVSLYFTLNNWINQRFIK